MFTEKLKAFFSGDSSGHAATARVSRPGRAPVAADPIRRQSNGLDQFFAAMRDTVGLSIVDFGSLHQANIEFLSQMGHRIYTVDLLRGFDQMQAAGARPEAVQEFLDENLQFRAFEFDAALVWDTLQFLPPHLLHQVIERLWDSLRPNALVFAMFSSDERSKEAVSHSIIIEDPKTMVLTPRTARPLPQSFNIRTLDQVFRQFQSTKYFLTRDHLREVLVKK